MRRYFVLVLLIVVLSFLQAAGFSVFGVKPNLALIAVIAVSFFIADIWEGFLLVLMSALILKFSPGFSVEILTFSLIAAAAIIIRKYLPWHSIINLFFLLTTATLLFYSFTSPTLIISNIFLQELFYNLIIGFITFTILNRKTVKIA